MNLKEAIDVVISTTRIKMVMNMKQSSYLPMGILIVYYSTYKRTHNRYNHGDEFKSNPTALVASLFSTAVADSLSPEIILTLDSDLDGNE